MKKILAFFMSVRKLGPHLYETIESSMTVYLLVSHVNLDLFMNQSLLYEEDQSIAYLKAITLNFTQDLQKWVSFCPPAKMYYMKFPRFFLMNFI